MQFGKHAIKVLAIFVALFLTGLLLKVFQIQEHYKALEKRV